MNDELAGTLLSALSILSFIAFLIWHSSRKRRLRLEEQSRVLDRLGSGDARCRRARRLVSRIQVANEALI